MVTYVSYQIPYFQGKTEQLTHGCECASDEFIEKHLADPRQTEEWVIVYNNLKERGSSRNG